MPHTNLLYSFCEAPFGSLLLAGDGERLHRIGFPRGSRACSAAPEWRRVDSAFDEARRQLAAYFGGELKRFDLPLHFSGTGFQQRVWLALCDIPWGKTLSYGELAQRIGSPAASRAVGAANGANPLPVVVPCHRVIGADGSLTGFGGGIETKRLLLRLEGVLPSDPRLDLLQT